MGFLDDAKGKLTDAVEQHGDKINAGLDKAKDVIDEKTGGKFGDKLDAGVDKAKDALGGLGNKAEGAADAAGDAVDGAK